MNSSETLKSSNLWQSWLKPETEKTIWETSLDIHNLILNEDLEWIINKVITWVYSLSKFSNEDDRRKELHTWVYIYPVLVNNKFVIDIGFLPYETEKILVINWYKKIEVSGDKKDQIKTKISKVYTLPIYHSNPDWTPRWAWI